MPIPTKDSPIDFRPTLADRAPWERRAAFLRDQVRLATGQPFARLPVRATINGTTEHDGYRVSDVCFASASGLYVTGNLYRPAKPRSGGMPAVLHPYGHWPDGRFQQTPDEKVDAAIASGAESLRASARAPLQAANVHLARMGCVVFQFDMVGYADSKPLPHMLGFDDAEAVQRGQSAMMLQTINSLAALDFLAGLPDVDASRIAVGGASSGGTQTLILGILDERPAGFFIAGMIGMAMQGGCPCEQSPGLRVDTNNVELCGLLAPRPVFCSGASGDWTRGFTERGLPELKAIYSLFDAASRVDGAVLPWPHNFNAHTRQAFYAFVDRTFKLGADVGERDFDVLTPAQLSVFDQIHFPPMDASDLATVRRTIAPRVDVGATLLTLLDLDDTARASNATLAGPGTSSQRTEDARDASDASTSVRCDEVAGPGRADGSALLDIVEGNGDPLEFAVRWRGAADPLPASRLEGKPDWFPLVFNRPPVLRAARELIDRARAKNVSSLAVVADRASSPAVLVACAAMPYLFRTVRLDLGGFEFDQVTSLDDPRLLPHALAMGGVAALKKAAAPTKLFDAPPAKERPMDPGLLSLDFLYESAPFPSCHSATIVETERGSLLASFFGGTHERHPDVCIYLCRRDGDRWTSPMQVADGVQPDGSRLPTWNPVLFQPRGGPVMLFYKVGPSPKGWWGMVKTSDDDGRTWSDARRLPDGILGPIKNKPVQLADGRIISPTSVEIYVDPNDDGARAAGLTVAPAAKGGWHVYFEISEDNGQTWRATPWVEQPPGVKAIQPSLLVHPNGRLQAIGRTEKSARLFTVWSDDAGRTWGPMTLTDLPNCNSGTDAVTLADGRHLLIYNHSDTVKVRYPLNLAISDDGVRWDAACDIETEPPGQYSYPSIIQARDGLVHVIYTWKRLKIRHGVIDPARLVRRPLPAF